MSKGKAEGPVLRFIRRSLIVVLVLVLLFAAYLVLGIAASRSLCVILPNGYQLGYPGIFALRKYPVYMVLRDSSGEVIVRGDNVELERVPGKPDQVKVIYRGGTMEMDGTTLMPVIWEGHPVTGPKRKWNEPKPEDPDSLDILGTDFWTIYLKLRRSNEFETASCGTPWFDWGE